MFVHDFFTALARTWPEKTALVCAERRVSFAEIDGAPISPAFCGPDAPEYVEELLAPGAVAATGIFNPAAGSRLLAKCRATAHVSENDNMALVGVLSAQLWHDAFIARFAHGAGETGERTDVVKVRAGAVAAGRAGKGDE